MTTAFELAAAPRARLYEYAVQQQNDLAAEEVNAVQNCRCLGTPRTIRSGAGIVGGQSSRAVGLASGAPVPSGIGWRGRLLLPCSAAAEAARLHPPAPGRHDENGRTDGAGKEPMQGRRCGPHDACPTRAQAWQHRGPVVMRVMMYSQ